MSKHHAGQRIFILATIVTVPSVGPITVQIGNGEAPGHNLAVHAEHLVVPAADGLAILPPVKTGTGEQDINTKVPRASAPLIPSSDPAVLTDQLKSQEPPEPPIPTPPVDPDALPPDPKPLPVVIPEDASIPPSTLTAAQEAAVPQDPATLSEAELERLTDPDAPLQPNPMPDAGQSGEGAEGQPS